MTSHVFVRSTLLKLYFIKQHHGKPFSFALTIKAILAIFLGYANIAAASLPTECDGLTAQATYIESTGIVCLQQIKASINNSTSFYKAALKWKGEQSPNSFEFINAEPDSVSDESMLTYSEESAILIIPKIDIPKTYGTERYVVTLKKNKNTSLFELTKREVYINPEYAENSTWKPYGMLDSKEKQTVDILGQSLPYAKLAQGIYNFENKLIDNWELIHNRSKDSGMQAGVYQNQETGEITLAFRGTTDGSEEKECDGFFNCLLDDIKGPFLDLISDISLVFGNDNAQFRHAFDYAQEVVDYFPQSTNITVTGHSLGGALSQATGTSLGLRTFAFNSAPVPDDFFDDHPVNLTDEELNNIHVIVDIHDPVSNADQSAKLYINASHVTHPVEFNFDTKQLLPNALDSLDDLRFNKHGIGKFIENASEVLTIYRDGW